MSTIKALVEVDIFDDPQFCEIVAEYARDSKRCPNLSGGCCHAFSGGAVGLEEGVNKIGDPHKFIKCDQCKELYQDTKSMDVSDIIMKIAEAKNKLKGE